MLMRQRALDYTETLSKLVELIGLDVVLTLRGADCQPPLCLTVAGALTGGPLDECGDALSLRVGEVDLLLHPSHFDGALWSAGRTRVLTLELGNVTVLVEAPRERYSAIGAVMAGAWPVWNETSAVFAATFAPLA
jgi:hypothetical protein